MVNFPAASTLVGRAGEVSALLGAVTDEQTHAVLVGGEAGIGKSRLITEFTNRLAAPTLVVVGRCPEFGTDGVPFAPFLTAMRSLLRLRGVEELAAALPPKPALANWLPQLAVHTGSAAPDFDRTRLFGEILTLVEHVALDGPVVLVLEDLHWADQASRDLLTFLIANLAHGDVLLVGTYRPGEVGPLRTLVAELRRNPGVQILAPQPLTRHEVGRQLASLLAREPEPALITRVFARSGGNPLFVEALSHSPEDTPAGLTELLLTFQAGLGPDARTVLQAAAVIGSPVPHALLVHATELPAAPLRDAVRELIDRHLLLATDIGYEFRHVLIRQAIYDDQLPIERVGLHARLSDALQTHPDLLPVENHSAELAHHAAAAGDLPRALTASWQAATVAAHPETLRQLERVLDLWDRVPEAAEQLNTTKLAVLERIIDAADRSRVTERGIAAADAALVLIDPDDEPVRAARLYRRRALLRSRTGAGPGEDLEYALGLLPEDPPALERGEVLAQLAASGVFNGDIASATRNATDALYIAEQLDASALTARACAYLGLAAADQPVIAIEHFAKAHAAAAAAEDPQTFLDVVTWESSVLVAAGKYDEAITAIQEGLRIAQETFRFTESAPILLVKWTQALTALGRWDKALALVDQTQLEQLPPLSRAALLLGHAKIALAQGNTEQAETTLTEVEQLLGHGQWAQQYRLQLQGEQCLLTLARGDSATAAQILTATASSDNAVATLVAHPHEAWPLVVLAARVPNSSDPLANVADSLRTTTSVDAAHRAVYQALTTVAAAGWDAAADAWRALNQPYEEAESLLAAAEAHAAEGNRPAASTALRAASALAVPLAAKPLIDAIDRVAKRARLTLDSVPHASRNSPERFGLTPRELDVLRLVAQGMSNRQLAAELFMSANTAGVHVSRILTKLAVSSRTEAAAFAHQHDLLHSSS